MCEFGRCRAACAANRDCPAGAACLPSPTGSACSVATDLGCESGVGRECPPGLVCVADRCEARCDAASDCPGDGACVVSASGVSFCGRAGEDDASVPRDGGPPGDAREVDAAAPAGCAQVCMTDDSHGCALVGGAVYCWGSDSGQRLGDGDVQHTVGGVCSACPGSATPVPVVHDGTTTPLTGMTSIACGGAHVCALDAAGAMFCWGDDGHGQLGTGASGAPTGAVRAAVFASTPLDRMALGRSHTCARARATRELRCVGENRSGQIDPSAADVAPDVHVLRPLLAASTTPMGHLAVSAIAAGGVWTCAVSEVGGALHCWGWNEQGQTGGSTPGTSAAAIDPGTQTIALNVDDVAAGYQTTCYVAGGVVRCLGSDIGGALGRATGLSDCTPGDGDANECSSAPVSVQPGVELVTVHGGPGANQFCGIGPSGAVCWGFNDVGQAGQPSSGPVRVALAPFLDARAGVAVCGLGLASSALCAALEDGRIACAGDDESGQRGDGTADDARDGVPTFVALP